MERALRVLDAFPEVGGDVGTNELARVTGINASTVSRILATLAAAGYVEHLPGDRSLPARPAGAAALEPRARRRSTCGRPPARTSTSWSTRPARPRRSRSPASRDAVTIDFVLSRASVASVARVGRPSIAHATATGKVMLAFAAAGAGRRAARALHGSHGHRPGAAGG